MLLFKIIGMVLIFAVCTMFGFLRADYLKSRSSSLAELLKSFSHMGELIRIGNYEAEELLSLCFEENIKFSDFSGWIKNKPLTKEDKMLLEDFFKGFGIADKEAEYERTKLYYLLLKEQYEAALITNKEQSRLYCTLGIAGGMFLCVFFI